MSQLDDYDKKGDPFAAENSWQKTSVKIQLPKEGEKFKSEANAPEFKVDGIVYCCLIEVMKASFQSPDSCQYHWITHKLFTETNDNGEFLGFPVITPPLNYGRQICLYSDIYNLDVMIEEDAKICEQLAADPEPDSPNVEIAITCLSFGLTQYTSPISVVHPFGPSTSCLAISQSMFVASQQVMLCITWHTSLQCVFCFVKPLLLCETVSRFQTPSRMPTRPFMALPQQLKSSGFANVS
jgi:hypothetical protein